MSNWEWLATTCCGLAAVLGVVMGLWFALQPIRTLTQQVDALAAEVDAYRSELERNK